MWRGEISHVIAVWKRLGPQHIAAFPRYGREPCGEPRTGELQNILQFNIDKNQRSLGYAKFGISIEHQEQFRSKEVGPTRTRLDGKHVVVAVASANRDEIFTVQDTEN